MTIMNPLPEWERDPLLRDAHADEIAAQVLREWELQPNRDAYVGMYIGRAARAGYHAGRGAATLPTSTGEPSPPSGDEIKKAVGGVVSGWIYDEINAGGCIVPLRRAIGYRYVDPNGTEHILHPADVTVVLVASDSEQEKGSAA